MAHTTSNERQRLQRRVDIRVRDYETVSELHLKREHELLRYCVVASLELEEYDRWLDGLLKLCRTGK